ncbi:transglutaminase superfamily protein [Arcticibacter pallidicorallinus]|uniref:Transglutaminase superfamily protein n=1 Tax=Arcticibacter pallidicorallinus TaxID=1259464 RepID=A0A2T0U8Q4_9SPHI|nr:transglutaminase-like domain-containing protein [Arcticibacter pallidicorallinus]PRY54311.1 transglutaminase superfamily protein [Arcticibacter pallidicorallinus]
MNKELEALVKLLDDPDEDISRHVEERLLSYGNGIIGFLESSWEHSFDGLVQQRIENLVHKIQFSDVKNELKLWYQSGAFDILEGMIIINRYQYPDMDPQKIINQIEEIKREVWMQMIYEMSPAEKVKLINHVFYQVFGFSGNTSNHQDPNNSYISQVLESKKGNQISLAVIYSIIAQKLDIPIYGVNLPQHFILAFVDEAEDTPADEQIVFYINAFNKGFIFGKRDVDSFLKQLNLKPEKHYYEPCSNLDIIRRVLRNLTSSYVKSGNETKVQEIAELIEAVEGQAPTL